MLKRIWNDPVWSKVVAGLILAGLASAAAYFLNWWPSIRRTLMLGWRSVFQTTTVPNWLLGLFVILALPVLALAAWIILSLATSKVSRDDRSARGDWRSYTTDEFYGLRWRWRYLLDTGTPDGLASFCPHCDFQVYPENASPFRAVDQIVYRCDSCNQPLSSFDESPIALEKKVARSIQQKGTRHKSSSSTLAESRANPGVRAKVFSGRRSWFAPPHARKINIPPRAAWAYALSVISIFLCPRR